MGNTYAVRLSEHDWGHLLDGLRSRSESWHYTARFMGANADAEGGVVIEECRDADEAHSIADHYDQIIISIEQQLKAQKALS